MQRLIELGLITLLSIMTVALISNGGFSFLMVHSVTGLFNSRSGRRTLVER